MKEIMELINTTSGQIFGVLFGFQAALILIDIMEIREGKIHSWLGEKWIKEHKSDIKNRLQKIIIIIVILIVYVIVMSLIYKSII